MRRRILSVLVFSGLGLLAGAAALEAQTLSWDHPSPTSVTGFGVTVDGTRTNYPRQNVSSGSACSCSVSLSLSPGQHTVRVAAYNSAGDSPAATLTVTIPSTPPPTPPPSGGNLPSPWLTRDIGSVGATGAASVSSGTFSISGAGADIWGTADGFRYVYQTVTGNATIVARLNGLQNTNAYAKAGLMIRDGTSAGATHAVIDVRPNGVIEFLSRGSAGGSTATVASTTQAAPVWLRLVRNGNTITVSFSTNGSNWTGTVSRTVSMAGTVNIGMVVCSHVSGTLNTATFSSVSVTGSASRSASEPDAEDDETVPAPPPADPGGAVPSPWTNQDVGFTNLSGSASYGSGSFSVSGAGADVWERADGFHYVYQPFTGNGSITARVVSLENTHLAAKAGLMLRGSLDAGAKDVLINVQPGGSIEFMARTSVGAETLFVASAGQTPPAWLRLTRSGNTVTGYVSRDGTSWTAVGSVNVSGTTVGGLFVNSHDLSTRNTAIFDSVTVSQ